MADQAQTPEFSVPHAKKSDSLQAAPPVSADGDREPTYLPWPLGPACAGDDYDSARIDIRVSVKARRGLRRLRQALDAVGAMRSNGCRANPNSPRDAVECLLEWIADAE